MKVDNKKMKKKKEDLMKMIKMIKIMDKNNKLMCNKLESVLCNNERHRLMNSRIRTKFKIKLLIEIH